MGRNFQALNNIVDLFQSNSVLCIGDMILDEYLSGNANRLSPEAPVPVVHLNKTKTVLGGVGNVAANLSALGCSTHVFYPQGNDADAKIVSNLLKDNNITEYPVSVNMPTIKKTRIKANKQQLCRIDREEPLHLSRQEEARIIHQITQILPQVNTVLISDYNKGFITPNIAQGIIQAAMAQNKRVLVDPKGTDYMKYKGATLIKPNLGELKTAIKHLAPSQAAGIDYVAATSEGLQQIKRYAQLMQQTLEIPKIVVTLGENGMLAVDDNTAFYSPTTAKAVSDVSGAGDTSLAIMGAALFSGATLGSIADLANIASGLVVAKEDTATLSRAELSDALQELFDQETRTIWTKNTPTKNQVREI
ncbi:MAG: D-glycero-beta-D-manno-heptose-7-phosphate kinase [Alphaproteobacteria bacterium]|nr:D-glycero-beta-D-manno-heptose-7-phosphate kinase [Alphaproteobacteria bacterium]